MLAGVLSPLIFTPPDLLISADARLIGLHRPGETRLLRLSGAQKFTEDSWHHLWVEDAQKLDCPTPICTLNTKPEITILRGDDTLGCDAGLRISPEPMRHHCTPYVPEIDRFDLWREGAHAVWLRPDGVRIASDWSLRGDRPWVLLQGPDHD